ncbi:Rab9 effector protein with kelch motifs [Acipenser ruthenus]|uniref:Rab9 effector protein with kelch motifs n=1 Tax=Acipenser ruthenus TaxID=7906 RepID=A0A444UWD0_ACIRT|nr:Rab9 effector protein with kelch motifs [Acipenser ruthenus]
MGLLQVLEPDQSLQKGTWYALVPRGESPGVRVGHTCTYLPSAADNQGKGKILIVGGANPNGSFSDSHIIDLARTYHTCTASIGDKLYVFGGGDTGAQPVDDAKLHVFDAATLTWSQPDTQGKAPSPRHGHVIVAVGHKLYIHEKQRWTLLKFEGLPAKRLDHSMCVIPWADPKASSPQAACGDQEWKDLAQQAADSTEEEKSSSSSRGTPVYLCFVFGGMDTEGGLYNDCIVTLLD